MALILLLGSASVSYGTKAQAAGTSTEYQVTVNNFWGAASNTQLVCAYASNNAIPAGSVFTGTVSLNGTETNVNWVVSGANFFLKKADGNVQITISECTSIGVYAGSKMTASNGSYITIQNDCFYEKNAGGTLVKGETPAPKPAEYPITLNNFWGAASNTQLVCGYTGNVPAGSVFTGTVLLNGTETNVNWVVSGANFFLKKASGNVQITISECNSVGVYAGSKMTASDGTCIVIQNDCFYEKNSSGNLVATTPPSQKPAVPDPTDHTPSTGIEIPEGVTVLKQVDFSGSDYQHSSSVGATTKNNVLVVGEDSYSRQLLYVNQLSTEKTYILSYYVWVAEEDGVYDMHFDDAGSPNGAGGNYTANVFAQWLNLHSTYIKNCTIDGVPTTASITDATNGWKKVEVEWTPKATGNVLIQLGDYGGESQGTGTTYIDDFLVYEKSTGGSVESILKIWSFTLLRPSIANFKSSSIYSYKYFSGDLFFSEICLNVWEM